MFSNNLKKLRLKHNMEQIDLAHRLGRKSSSSISEWESGKYTPKAGILSDIAEIFNVSLSDLMNKDLSELVTIQHNNKQQLNEVFDELKENRQLKVVNYAKSELKEQKASNSKVVDISEYQIEKEYPYYDDAVSAGTGQYIGTSQKETITLPVDFDADFVVPVYGDSMEPDYHDGDYIFVKLSVDLSDGDIGVFELYGDTYVKQLVIEDDHAYLHSLNKKYKDMLVDADSDFRIIGKVVGRFA